MITRKAGRWRALILLALFVLLGGNAGACIWDRDTVLMEARIFPGALDVMTGRFPRHSPEFYQWRVSVTRAKLAANKGDRTPALLDDLAVATHKLGRHEEAIRIMMESLDVEPRRYETLSNLGTFTIYAGDLAASRRWLTQALEINPDAHFGRERYQLWLVEQLMLKRDLAALPELTSGFSEATLKTLQTDYARFVQLRVNLQEGWARETLLRELSAEEQAKAIEGVLGMMRFADFDNPVLQAALGDLMALQTTNKKAPQLAAMAYEHALMKTRDSAERDGLVERSLRALPSLRDKKRRLELVKKLDQNLTEGRKIAALVRADEIVWIRERRDVEAEFDRKYLSAEPGRARVVRTR